MSCCIGFPSPFRLTPIISLLVGSVAPCDQPVNTVLTGLDHAESPLCGLFCDVEGLADLGPGMAGFASEIYRRLEPTSRYVDLLRGVSDRHQ